MRRRAAAGTFALVFFIGLYDEGQAAAPLNSIHDAIRTEWTALSTFVHALEGRLPAGAMVFQLPAVHFLNETGREQMGQFDHIKLYLPSRLLRWSYPAISDEVVRWQQRVSRLPPRLLSTALAREGFAAILIDRNGYADRGQSILSDLGVSASSDAVLVENTRYIAVDLRLVRKEDVPANRLPRLEETPTGATRGVAQCADTTPVILEWVGEASTPFGRSPIRVPSAGEFSVTGWAVDQGNQGLAGDVDILIGDKALPAFYGIERSDVAAHLGSPAYGLSGFTARIKGTDLGSDLHLLSIRILASDRSCYYQGPMAWIEAR